MAELKGEKALDLSTYPICVDFASFTAECNKLPGTKNLSAKPLLLELQELDAAAVPLDCLSWSFQKSFHQSRCL